MTGTTSTQVNLSWRASPVDTHITDVLQWEPEGEVGWTRLGEMLEPTDGHAASTIEVSDKLMEICYFK